MAFRLIRGLHNLRPEHCGSVATIGSFDGLHRGHRAIIEQLLAQSRLHQLPSVVILFEPQPFEFFASERAPARLMRLADKIRGLAALGVDRVLCIQFNRRFSEMSAEDFVQQVLITGLGIKSLVVGDDFRFGRGRAGDFEMLKAAGERAGFTVFDTQTVEHLSERISSTRIRAALEAEEFALAEALLGYPYTMRGKVVYGQQLGRTINVPTANVQLKRYRSPLNGVYAVLQRELPDGVWREGVANVGIRPTVGGATKPILEVHLLDYAGDLYGQQVEVSFVKKLREERKFPDFNALKEQIYLDIAEAKRFFAEQIEV